MLEQIKELLREFIADGEVFDLVAQGLKKSHEALIKAGFTEAQATQVIAGQGMGLKAS